MEKDDIIIKYEDCYSIVLIGDSNVGKTCILNKYCNNKFSYVKSKNKQTEVYKTKIELNDNTYILKIWDPVLNNKNFSINKKIYERADCIVMVFSLIDKNSFINLEKWFKVLYEQIDDLKNKLLLIIGNKFDLTKEIVINENNINDKAKSLNIKYFLVSAMNGEGLTEMFNYIISNLTKNTNILKENEVSNIHKNEEEYIKINDSYNNYSSGNCT